ncbi:11688_t:CDS:2 [Funneliformis mosseae]|uniref:11688_t:CDS:1 n=1 Tax=Funneliformis mosseae TaxID=27381 RepID=A0A9N9ABY1_FUNMO|nr:11688_t:CDS:2 [Funneliformis mosseae]
MVLLVLTDRIRTAIYQAVQSPEFDESAKKRLKSYLKASACVPLDLIKEVSKFLLGRDGKLGKEIGLSNYWLHDLLTGSGVYVEPRKEKPKSPELIARLESILAEQANKEYARMIGRVASSYDVETFKLLDTEEFQSVRGQLTAIINITFTVVAVFAAVYHVAQTITGDTGMRVLLAFTGSVIVGVAETILYMRYLTGYDKIEQKERKPRRRSSASSVIKPRPGVDVTITPDPPVAKTPEHFTVSGTLEHDITAGKTNFTESVKVGTKFSIDVDNVPTPTEFPKFYAIFVSVGENPDKDGKLKDVFGCSRAEF